MYYDVGHLNTFGMKKYAKYSKNKLLSLLHSIDKK